jgi:hypothetical protein
MKKIRIRLTDKEYDRYVKKGQSEYRMRMKKAIEMKNMQSGCLCLVNIIEVREIKAAQSNHVLFCPFFNDMLKEGCILPSKFGKLFCYI